MRQEEHQFEISIYKTGLLETNAAGSSICNAAGSICNAPHPPDFASIGKKMLDMVDLGRINPLLVQIDR